MAVHFSTVSIPRIDELGGSTWELQNLSDVTVLFGKNGSGKSVLLRAWRDKSEDNVHYVAPERTGAMDFQPQYLQEELNPSVRRSASSRNYMPEYRRRIIGRVQSYFLTRGAYRGSDAAPVPPTEIEGFVNNLVTDFLIELVGSGTLPYKLQRVEGGVQIESVDQLSSGEAQLVTIALDILTIAALWEIQSQKECILLIDEPDAHIHPDLQTRFADFIFRISERFKLQIAIATHSTSLLAALGQFGGEKTTAIYMSRTRREYQAQPFTAIHKELSACLGGHVLMGPLFGTPILLVEGDDDYRIWSQVPRHHVTNLAVIPSNGEEIYRYQKILERILSTLRDDHETPCGFALLDGDKSLPEASPQNPQQHIRFLRLACHEAENLYLTDEVLALLGTDWESASDRIVAKSGDFGQKADLLAAAKTWNRKQADLKEVIEELTQVLDEKHLHWTMRVGRAVGATLPTGQIADFLGSMSFGHYGLTQLGINRPDHRPPSVAKPLATERMNIGLI
ncbi:MAG: AAA family ATPase [Planctomycetota bacterium]|nr:AAA family ATPase [Planctomycetota bacterium]